MNKTITLLMLLFSSPALGSASVAQQSFADIYPSANKIKQLELELEDASESLQEIKREHSALICTVTLHNRAIQTKKSKLSPASQPLFNLESLEVSPRYLAPLYAQELPRDAQIRKRIKDLETERDSYISWYGKHRQQPNLGWEIIHNYNKISTHWYALSKKHQKAIDQLMSEEEACKPQFEIPED